MTAAVGNLSLGVDRFMTTLAESAAFQSWTASLDANGARRRIHRGSRLPKPENGRTYTRAELEAYRPYALVSSDTYQSAPDSSSSFKFTGTVTLILERDVPAPISDDGAEVEITFDNAIGQIFEDLETRPTPEGHVVVTGIDQSAWTVSHPDVLETQGEFQTVEAVVSYDG